MGGNPMSNGFERHLEARRYADSVTSIPARGALHTIHTLILEAAGTHLRFLPERYLPVHTLDVLFFYKAVERLFAEWTDEVRLLPEAPGTRARLLQPQEAEALIPTLPTERARIGLANFISILLATSIPTGTVVDALFCCRLVSVLLSYPGLLERILSGEAEKDANAIVWDD
jgi:hypothetical protein